MLRSAIDRTGKEVFRLDAFLTFDFSEGLAPASPKHPPGQYIQKWGFIDRTGRYVIEPKYDWVDSFSEGLAKVSLDGEFNTTGYIDRSGTIVIPPTLVTGESFHEGLAAAIVDGPCRAMNGGSCGPLEFEPSQLNARYRCQWTYIDKTGKPISNLRFDAATDFSEGRAAVRVVDEWGYVDHSGQFTIPPQYSAVGPFSEGLAAVSRFGTE